ncbi:MAG: chorismate-binding protein [Salinivirgaceae bacterium]
MGEIFDQVKKALEYGIPFAVWVKPGEQKVNHLFCRPDAVIKTYTLSQLDKHKGFVFAPFQVCKHLPIYILPFDAQIGMADFKGSKPRKRFDAPGDTETFVVEKSRKEHIRQVEVFLKTFKETGMQKAVLSRNKWLPDYSIEHLPELYSELHQNYPNAFVYQIYLPQVGYWIGATPELLFSTQNGSATTVSLAGTQPLRNTNEVVWDQKEAREQELVTEHIRSVLSSFQINDFSEQGPETAVAGNMVHLKTVLEFSKENIKNRIGTFIEKLHPTPAVCGLPVKESMELILETEGYDREYYTGFLGPFDPTQTIDLFVNLRCLQAFDNGVVLYAGGGITPESDPEKEWEETRIKIQTLERILEKI